MSAKPQFTPRQILEAGLRAENVNQLEHAAQFYRFLLDHHAGAPETEAARGHLRRINSQRPDEGASRTETPPTGPAQRHASTTAGSSATSALGSTGQVNGAAIPTPHVITRSDLGDRGSLNMALNPLAPPTPSGDAAGALGQPQPAPGYGDPNGYAPAPPPADYRQPMSTTGRDLARVILPHLHLPDARRRYIVGRFIAGALIALGLMALVGGAALFGLAIFTPTLKLPIPLPVDVTIGATMLLGGLGAILVGQAARALFDSANATRELVDIVRAVVDPHATDRERR
jgi:hypothetical protein